MYKFGLSDTAVVQTWVVVCVQNIPFAGQAIAAALRSIEGVVDSLAYAVIDSCQDKAGDLTTLNNGLDVRVPLHASLAVIDSSCTYIAMFHHK